MIGFILVLLSACGRSYECCEEGLVTTCVCPPGGNCAEAIPYATHEDGTCEFGARDSGDTAAE